MPFLFLQVLLGGLEVYIYFSGKAEILFWSPRHRHGKLQTETGNVIKMFSFLSGSYFAKQNYVGPCAV